MSHVLHTVVVSYERPELLERTVKSYAETVTLPYTMVVVDNGSGPGVARVLPDFATWELLGQNYYPGYAANRGFEQAPLEATLLHRSDNDMEYQEGWCDEVVARFEDDPKVGQVGLRTIEEEGNVGSVGGNSVIRREVWDAGARYDERPWTENAWEDGTMSQTIRSLGYEWRRVQRPCAIHIGIASSTDPYYQKTFADRGITFAEWGVE